MIFFLLEHSIHFWSQDMDKHHRHPVVNRPDTRRGPNGAKETRAIDWSGGLEQGGKKIDRLYYHSTSFLKIIYTQFGCTDSFYFFTHNHSQFLKLGQTCMVIN